MHRVLGSAVRIFSTLAPTVGREGSPAMAGKRSSTTRPQAESSKRGRPRRTVRSAYATAEQEGPEDMQPEADQAPPVAELAESMAAQELQLLQAQL